MLTIRHDSCCKACVYLTSEASPRLDSSVDVGLDALGGVWRIEPGSELPQSPLTPKSPGKSRQNRGVSPRRDTPAVLV